MNSYLLIFLVSLSFHIEVQAEDGVTTDGSLVYLEITEIDRIASYTVDYELHDQVEFTYWSLISIATEPPSQPSPTIYSTDSTNTYALALTQLATDQYSSNHGVWSFIPVTYWSAVKNDYIGDDSSATQTDQGFDSGSSTTCSDIIGTGSSDTALETAQAVLHEASVSETIILVSSIIGSVAFLIFIAFTFWIVCLRWRKSRKDRKSNTLVRMEHINTSSAPIAASSTIKSDGNPAQYVHRNSSVEVETANRAAWERGLGQQEPVQKWRPMYQSGTQLSVDRCTELEA